MRLSRVLPAAIGSLLILLPAALAAGPAHASPRAPRPAAFAPEGWRPTFSSDFSGSSLPRQCAAYDGPHGGKAASSYHPDEVRVSDGLLHLGMREQDYEGRPYRTGGVTCYRVDQLYGRYEYRAKAPVGNGIDAYVTLWPADEGVSQHATLLEVLPRPGQEKLYVSNEYGSGESNAIVPGRYSDGFHTYVIEWTPASLRVLVDGEQVFADKHVSRQRRWIGFAVSSGDALTGLPDAGTSLPAEFQLDSLRVWAYDPSAGTPSATPGGFAQASAASTASYGPASPTAAAEAEPSPVDATAGGPVAQPGRRVTWLLAGGAILGVLLVAGVLELRRRASRRVLARMRGSAGGRAPAHRA